MTATNSSNPNSPVVRRKTGFDNYRFALWGILAVAIAARIAILVAAEVRPALFDFPDSNRYVTVARNIAAGLGPINDSRNRSNTDPLYPLILSAAPLSGVESQAAILRFGRISNAIFSLASVTLLAAIGRRLFGRSIGILAALLLAIDPILLFFNALILTESLYIFLLLLAAYSTLRLSDTPEALAEKNGRTHLSWAFAAGLSLGLATLARSTSLFFPILLTPIVAVWVRKDRRENPRTLVVIVCFLFACYFPLVPSLIRNYGLFHAIVPARIGGGASLMEALGPWADGSPGMDRIQYPDFPPDADELERDRLCREAAFEWAYSHPRETISLALAKLKRTWSVEIHAAGYTSPLLRAVCWLTVAPVFLLALNGIWRTRKRPAVLALLLAPAAYFTLIHMVFVGSVRYRLPAMPFLFVLAAAGLMAVIERRTHSCAD